MKAKVLLSVLFSVFTISLFAQEDAEGCKDHPFFNRMPNFHIDGCQSNYNAVDFQFSASKIEKTEGNITYLVYTFGSETAKMPSPLQIIKNYENAIVAKGGKKLYSGENGVDDSYGAGGPMGATFSFGANGKEYLLSIRGMYEPAVSNEVGKYSFILLEKEGMKQDIMAAEMFKKINSEGKIALYINFETGKADIKPESQKIIDQIAEMMKSNPSLKVSIEGHTDNAGNAASNQTLSENRAKSVVNAVGAKGIDKTRMSSKGWGQTKPLKDNSTEDGKAANRRVEIVKM